MQHCTSWRLTDPGSNPNSTLDLLQARASPYLDLSLIATWGSDLPVSTSEARKAEVPMGPNSSKGAPSA